jgi:hypothetical protein
MCMNYYVKTENTPTYLTQTQQQNNTRNQLSEGSLRKSLRGNKKIHYPF